MRQSRSDVDRSGNIEMIKKCIELLKSSTIFDTFITSHDIEDKLL